MIVVCIAVVPFVELTSSYRRPSMEMFTAPALGPRPNPKAGCDDTSWGTHWQ
jgi:hypothetical protein